MNGAGNDFIIFDNRAGEYDFLNNAQIAELCDRHRGVGADGILFVEKPSGSGADFKMRYHNADGAEAEMCGNGLRCFVRFVTHLSTTSKLDPGKSLAFETQAGTIAAQIEGTEPKLRMTDPKGGKDVGEVQLNDQKLHLYFINTGVPHVVVPVHDLENVDVQKLGSEIRHHDKFAPSGANVNFIKALAPNKIAIRTYERGVEGETLACGTGTVASALIYAHATKAPSPITVQVRGGDDLIIGFNPIDLESFAFREVTLKGPAEFVFSGEIII